VAGQPFQPRATVDPVSLAKLCRVVSAAGWAKSSKSSEVKLGACISQRGAV